MPRVRRGVPTDGSTPPPTTRSPRAPSGRTSTWAKKEVADGDEWHEYENLNFINEVDSGDIYLVAMGTDDNKAILYRVDRDGPHFKFHKAGGRGLNTKGAADVSAGALFHANTRWGSGVHVTPDGNIAYYVVERTSGGIEEFRDRVADPFQP